MWQLMVAYWWVLLIAYLLVAAGLIYDSRPQHDEQRSVWGWVGMITSWLCWIVIVPLGLVAFIVMGWQWVRGDRAR